MKYWTLIWIIISPVDGGYEASLYESAVYYRTPEACYTAMELLDEKLLDEGHENFTTTCEEREL